MNVARMLTDTVSVALRTGASSYGDPIFGSVASMKARVEQKNEEVAASDGSTFVASHVVVTETEISIGSRVWLSGESTSDTNIAKYVRGAKRASTPGGYTLFEAYL